MAGGTFTPGEDKVRPGIYMNFVSAAQSTVSASSRGTVAVPIIGKWGQSKTFLKIVQNSDVSDLLGFDISSPEMLGIREIKKHASTILAYRLNTGTQATGTWGTTVNATVTAKFGGARGNDIKIVVAANIVDEAKKDISVYLAGQLVDKQTVAQISDFVADDYVSLSGTGIPEDTAGVPLSGGADGSVVNQDYSDFLDALETQFFDVLAFPVTDDSLKATCVSFVKRLREDEGVKIQGVIPEYSGDYEGIISVKNGYILSDGTLLDKVQSVYWVAGATAGAAINQSNTYLAVDGATDVDVRMKSTDVTQALKDGHFVFTNDGTGPKVESDINSLKTYTTDRPEKWHKNRVVRTLDAVNNDIKKSFTTNSVGKIDNNADGHAIVKAAIIVYLTTLQGLRAVKNVNSETDVIIDETLSVDDKVFAKIGVQPVDSAEKFYFTVEVA